MKNVLKHYCIAALLFVSGCGSSLTKEHISTNSEITSAELKAHVKYLASDELEGRGSGTEGNKKAAEYLAEQFKAYGLKPAGENETFFQPFDFVSAVKLGGNNALAIEQKGKRTSLKVDEDFRPYGFSSNAKATGSLVFAGYGITATDKNYDDYKNLDVNGKIVVVLRYGPDGNDPHSDFNKYTALRNKARVARDKGAAGLIIVDATEDEIAKLSYDQSFASSGIPCISMKRSILVPLLKSVKRDVQAIVDTMKATKQPVTFEFPDVKFSLETEVVKVMSKTSNVVGYIEGSDTNVKDEVVVIGAHFDHLGYGGVGSGSLMPDTHAIHNGADDNASGTAAMLELAQKFASNRTSVSRTLLFMGFSGEELGTLGSQHYVNNPFFPLNRTIAMINMDEVGRLKDNVLTVYGTGTSPEWTPLIKKYNTGLTSVTDTFAIKPVPDGFGPSDHAQFYGKDIPVLFFFTGTHNDYHKPSDDWDKINYEGEEKVVRYIYNIANDIQSKTGKPLFAKAQSASPMGGGGDSRGFTVTLGVIPDYGESSDGMKIGGTRPSGPAEKAGMKAGDLITKFAGKKVLNIYDYMGILGELKAGDVVEVEAVRDGKPMKFSVTMQKR